MIKALRLKPTINQAGEANVLLLPLMLALIFLIVAASFGFWSFTSRQEYKNNTEQMIAAAVENAKREEGIAKDKAFAEAEKSPLEMFTGPAAFGSIAVEYPKTWSVYVSTPANGNQPVDAFFSPRVVPAISDQTATYALRVQVVNQQYATVVKSIESQVKSKTVRAAPYALPKVPEVSGLRVDGQVNPSRKATGSMIILPLRDKTIKIWTENSQYQADFDNIILPRLTFVP